MEWVRQSFRRKGEVLLEPKGSPGVRKTFEVFFRFFHLARLFCEGKEENFNYRSRHRQRRKVRSGEITWNQTCDGRKKREKKVKIRSSPAFDIEILFIPFVGLHTATTEFSCIIYDAILPPPPLDSRRFLYICILN